MAIFGKGICGQRFIGAFAIALTALLLLLTPVGADEITSCTVINESGTYYLASDISGEAAKCIVI
ncbi:MAG: hypothetical protein ACXQTS_04080, partial [Candidatus Methanospirareceae archaeon]